MTNPAKIHVAVVGAGAAGLTAAMRAGEAGARVTLLNAHPRIGLKILMSGGTRCNVTHREVTERDFNGGSRPFVARVLRAFTAEQAREWMESLGVRLKLEETGKYFPESDDAQTVLDALLGGVSRAGVEVVSGARVVRLEPESKVPRGTLGFRLGIQRVEASAKLGGGDVSGHREGSWPLPEVAVDEWRMADRVILATGGLSFPRTGSDGTGYALATALGHTLVPPVPALTPLASHDVLCREAQGVTLDAELTLRVAGKKTVATRGSLLMAHFGFSGPAALDLSRHYLTTMGERRVTVNFVPGASLEALESEWIAAGRATPRQIVRRHFVGKLPERIVELLAGEAGVAPGERVSQVDSARRRVLLERIVSRDLHVTGTMGYEKAEVTAGGVALSEVNPTTLESRVVPGVFLCGEVLDVEGRLGGFNFQWSWSSGTVAGRAAAST